MACEKSVWILITGPIKELPYISDLRHTLVFEDEGAAREVQRELASLRDDGIHSDLDEVDVNGHTIQLGEWDRVMEQRFVNPCNLQVAVIE